jgi:hypothetical protein
MMTKQQMIERRAEIAAIPKHLREFEEQCEWRSLGTRLYAIQLAEERQAQKETK